MSISIFISISISLYLYPYLYLHLHISKKIVACGANDLNSISISMSMSISISICVSISISISIYLFHLASIYHCLIRGGPTTFNIYAVAIVVHACFLCFPSCAFCLRLDTMFMDQTPPMTYFVSSERYWLSRFHHTPTAVPRHILDMAHDFAAFEYTLFMLQALEINSSLLLNFSPEGIWSDQRKDLSHIGGVRTAKAATCTDHMIALRDPGNYVYGLIMRSLASSTFDTSFYNDVMLGDILEAALGYAWQLHFGKMKADESMVQLAKKYFLSIERAVIACEKVVAHTRNLPGFWMNSKELKTKFLSGERIGS